MATDAGPFEIEVQILPGDVDGMGHANNIVYVRWVQEVALAHWAAAAPADAQAAMTWVALRHEIDYLRPARRHLGGVRRVAADLTRRLFAGPDSRDAAYGEQGNPGRDGGP
jgi:hypothetical protein